jgi:hypothetical protein
VVGDNKIAVLHVKTTQMIAGLLCIINVMEHDVGCAPGFLAGTTATQGRSRKSDTPCSDRYKAYLCKSVFQSILENVMAASCHECP